MKSLAVQPTTAVARQEGLAELIAKAAEKDNELTEDANRADEIDSPEAGQELLTSLLALPVEWKDRRMAELGIRDLRQLRRMIDAKRPTKDAPLYMAAALKRQEVRLKVQSGGAPGPQVNIIFGAPAQAHEDDENVIEVQEVKR